MIKVMKIKEVLFLYCLLWYRMVVLKVSYFVFYSIVKWLFGNIVKNKIIDF